MKQLFVLNVNDGGGVKGIMQSTCLSLIEDKIKAHPNKFTDLWVGTSVGAILSGVMASGKMSAFDFDHLMKVEIPKTFKRRFRVPFFQPKYTNKLLQETLRYYLGNMKLGDVKKPLVITSCNICDGRTHFFKSYDKKDRNRKLVDVISYSYAAPLYFGSISDKKHKAVWVDGGTGSMNSPMDEAFCEALYPFHVFKDNPTKKLHIFNLGTGYSRKRISFKKASKFKNPRQVLFYADPFDGGLARTQVGRNKAFLLKNLSENFKDFSFQRINPEIKFEADGLDKVKYMNYYTEVGRRMFNTVNLKPLIRRLSYE
jgi:hypothetical protein